MKGASAPSGAVYAISGIRRARVRIRKRKNREHGGQNLPYQANSVAAGGANASAFGPTAASTSMFPVFSLTDS